MRNRETIEFLPETKQLALIVKSHFYFKAVVCRLIVLLFTCSCLGVGLPCQTWGLELPEKPVPRIELGLHSDKIYQIGLDRSGRWLVSASEDKTARVWDMRQLRAGGDDVRPVRILRPPIGPGNDGKLYSVAISPDGELVATAGWTQSNGMGHSSSSDYAVYLFSRRTGRLLGKAEGLQNTITHLAFSPNGRLLAATLYSTNGVQLFAVTPAKLTKGKPAENSTAVLRLIAQDRNYGSGSFGVHFSPDGTRLVTSSIDGYVRLYDVPAKDTASNVPLMMTPIVERQVPGGKRPFRVKYSPDGTRIAVGFDDTARVNVLSSRDLSLMYEPQTAGAKGDYSKVAWSTDGHTLFAAGRGNYSKGKSMIRCWNDAGAGSYTDLKSGSTNTIMDLAPYPGGRIVFSGSDASIGIAGDGYDITLKPALADFRKDGNKLLLSHDGATVSIETRMTGNSRSTFSLPLRTELETMPANLMAPDDTSLPVQNWDNSTKPTLNHKELLLDPFEASYSLAISADKKSFLLGTSFALFRFDKDGRVLWQTATPGSAWAVNVSADGRFCAAACGDGTIRWYRYDNGSEVLALFLNLDNNSWVVWTPDGYFDASPGGANLIGYHINQGRYREAKFISAAAYKNKFYRPDVVQARFRGDKR